MKVGNFQLGGQAGIWREGSCRVGQLIEGIEGHVIDGIVGQLMFGSVRFGLGSVSVGHVGRGKVGQVGL